MEARTHPMDEWLRKDRIPHIWCPGCGIGIIMTCYIDAIRASNIPREKAVVASGIGCTGRIPGYINLDSFHTTHGRSIPFAIGLKLGNPELNVTILSGDGDLFAIGGNHFIHAARRNVNLTIICNNNFIYGMTGGQVAPTTPLKAITSTSPYGNFEHPFNLVHVAAATGAVYVARWTALHVRRLRNSISEAINKKGFSFIEVISPCPTSFVRKNKMGTGMDVMKYYQEKSVIKHGYDPAKASIEMGGEIVVGKFIDIEKPTFGDNYNEYSRSIKGD